MLCVCIISYACSLRCTWSDIIFVSACRCSVFVLCLHPVAVLNAAFGVILRLLMFLEDARGDHMD